MPHATELGSGGVAGRWCVGHTPTATSATLHIEHSCEGLETEVNSV
jgi:hypothetical protein